MKGQLVLGLASGLEAFSREPPCDSIGALAVRQTPETSGMAWEFLSYYPRLPSRCLRAKFSFDCLVDTNAKRSVPGGHKRSPRSVNRRVSRNSQLSRVKPTCLTTV